MLTVFLLLLWVACMSHATEAFFVQPRVSRRLTSSFGSAALSLHRRPRIVETVHLSTSTNLSMSTNKGSDQPLSSKKRRRRRRKEVTDPKQEVKTADVPAAAVEESPPELKPRDDAPVELVIQDVRDVVSGGPSKTKVATKQADDAEKDDDDDDDDDEYEYYYDGDEENAADSLEQLLADARQMRDERDSDEPGGFSVPDSVRNAISTIVTVDFFVVCLLLLWFLAGIFGSYVLKDDGIQIAFNGIFQPVVQPALGILMIASAAGAVFKKDEEEIY